MRQTRQLYWPPFSPLLKRIVGFTIVCFILQKLDPYVFNNSFQYYLTLVPARVVHGFAIWQLVSYIFLHGGILHIILNMLMLWMFGAELERIWGSKRFIIFYLAAGVFAGVISVISYYEQNTPIVGASGSIYALLVAYGFMYPNRELLFFGIFPMKTKYFIMLICVITFYVALGEGGGNVAHFAHIGGIAFGLIYMKFGQWVTIFGRYKEIRKKAERDKLKARFKVISDQTVEKKVDDFWESHSDDNPKPWN